MRTAMRQTMRQWRRDFMLGMALGFVGALIGPRRRKLGKQAEPPAPRPLDVPIEAAYEEPATVPVRRAA